MDVFRKNVVPIIDSEGTSLKYFASNHHYCLNKRVIIIILLLLIIISNDSDQVRCKGKMTITVRKTLLIVDVLVDHI